VTWPQGIPETLPAYAGQHAWRWTAGFEAYTAQPARLGSVPPGRYRFVVNGKARAGRAERAYEFVSEPFTVDVWRGIPVTNAAVDGAGDVAFDAPQNVGYPRSYTSAFRFVRDDGNPRICETCTFRPWARSGRITSAVVEVRRNGSLLRIVPATLAGTRWHAPAALAAGDTALIIVSDQDANTGSASVTR
jgi:hypothetical protein